MAAVGTQTKQADSWHDVSSGAGSGMAGFSNILRKADVFPEAGKTRYDTKPLYSFCWTAEAPSPSIWKK
jgi:hypothetical protein